MPLLWLSLAFLAGIVLGRQMTWPKTMWLALAAVCLGLMVVGFLLNRRRHFPHPNNPLNSAFRLPPLPVPAGLILAVFCLGAARLQAALPHFGPGDLAWYNNRPDTLTIEGLLIQPGVRHDRNQQLVVQASRLCRPGDLECMPVIGKALATTALDFTWRYGDRLRLSGKLQTPPDGDIFSYRDYLARQDIHTTIANAQIRLLQHDQGGRWWGSMYKFKERSQIVVRRILPDPEASLLEGILLGVDEQIPEQVMQAFRDTGASHVIAISGFNISILSGLFATIFGSLLGRRRGALAAALAIAFYTLLVGAAPSVVRAAVMGGLSLLAGQLGRRQDGLNSLGFVAALMNLFNPFLIWDVGFQLSFMATLGLVLYATPLTDASARVAQRFFSQAIARKIASLAGNYLLFTLSAQLTTLPITLYHFQRFSLLSILVNLLILPAQPALMITGGIALIAGLVSLPLGQAFAYLAWPFLAYTIHTVEGFAAFRSALWTVGPISLALVVIYYGLLFGWTFAAERLQHIMQRFMKPSLALGGLLIAVVLTWKIASSAPDNLLHLTVLEVGSGEALLIQTPEGRFVLIGGGPSSSRLANAIGRRMPLNFPILDFIIVPTTNSEQMAALSVTIERFKPLQALLTDSALTGSSARSLRAALTVGQTPLIQLENGQTLDMGRQARLHVLAAGKRGAVLRLEWQNFSALLPLGADTEIQTMLLRAGTLEPVTALLLADCGSAEMNPPHWLTALQPQLLLLSVDAADRRGLPDAGVLETAHGYTLLRTDRNGWIELTTDGRQLWVETER